MSELGKRDCKHGHLARKCELCELEKENAELRSLLRGFVGCHAAMAPWNNKCGFMTRAKELLP